MKTLKLLATWWLLCTAYSARLVLASDGPPIDLDTKEDKTNERIAIETDSERLADIPLAHVKKIFSTEVDTGFDNDEESWKESVDYAWDNYLVMANDKINTVRADILRRRGNHTKRSLANREEEEPKALMPFLVCDITKGKNGEACVETMENVLETEQIMGMYNKDDMTCAILMAFSDVALKHKNEDAKLSIIPLSPELKMAPRLAETIATKAEQMGRIEAVLCPPPKSQANYDGNDTKRLAEAHFVLQELFSDSNHHGRKLFHDAPRARTGHNHWKRILETSSTHDITDEDCLSWMYTLDAEPSARTIVWNVVDSKPTAYCLHTMVVNLSLMPQVCAVAASPAVQTFNRIAASIVQGQSSTGTKDPLYSVGLNGTGQVVAVSDTGLDGDNCYFHDEGQFIAFSDSGQEVNLNHRKLVQYVTYQDNSDTTSGHGTHVAGSIAGHAPGMDGDGAGMASGAKLAFFDIGKGTTLRTPAISSLFDAGYEHALARIHSMSWGSPTQNAYSSTDHALDVFMFEHPDFLAVVAVGNDGRNGPNTAASPALTKNGISVGASLNDIPHIHARQHGRDYLAEFSSHGPTADGRRKPDVVAPGQYIRSARAAPESIGECDNTHESGLVFRAGTSMATPFVSGSAAIIRQYFVEGWFVSGKRDPSQGFSPRASLIKATLVNSGVELVGIDRNSNDKDPLQTQMYDNNQGFGRVNLLSTLPIEGQNEISARFVNAQRLAHTGDHVSYTVTTKNDGNLACRKNPLSVTLVWTDPPVGAFCSGSCVLNDLDLSIVETRNGMIYYPNGLIGPDEVNNVERIRIDSPYPGTDFEIRVKADQMIGAQDFSLVISGCFQSATSSESPSRSPSSVPTTGSPSSTPSTIKPSLRPITGEPSLKPTTLSMDNESECQDYFGTFAFGSMEQTCQELSDHTPTTGSEFAIYCDFWDIVQLCPKTCNLCHVYHQSLGLSEVTTRDIDGSVRYQGVTFSVQAAHELVLESFDLHLMADQRYTAQVFTKVNMDDSWELVCESSVMGRGRYSFTPLPSHDCSAIRISPQEPARQFYVTLNGSYDLILTRNGPFTNSDLTMGLGSAVAHFDGMKYSGFGLDGRIRYRRREAVACVDSAEAVNMGKLVGQRTCSWLKSHWNRFAYICQFQEPARLCPRTCGCEEG